MQGQQRQPSAEQDQVPGVGEAEDQVRERGEEAATVGSPGHHRRRDQCVVVRRRRGRLVAVGASESQEVRPEMHRGRFVRLGDRDHGVPHQSGGERRGRTGRRRGEGQAENAVADQDESAEEGGAAADGEQELHAPENRQIR